MRIFFIVLFCLIGHNIYTYAQSPEALHIIKQSDSRSRIRALCIFFDDNIHSKHPEKFDEVIASGIQYANQIQDIQFKKYLEFYKKNRSILLIKDENLYDRKAKMLSIWQLTLHHYQSNADVYFETISHAYIAHIYFMRKEYGKSLENWLLVEEKFRKIGFNKFPDVGKHLHNMALVFYFFRDYKKAADLMEISIKLPAYAPNYHIQSYNTLGSSYFQLTHHKKAERAYVKTIETAKLYQDKTWEAIGSNGLAQVWESEGKSAQAKAILLSSLPILEKLKFNYKREFSEHLLSLSKTSIALGELNQAKNNLNLLTYKKAEPNDNQLFVFGATYQDINYWLKYYEVQYKLNDALKNYKTAYKFADSLYSMRHKIDSTFNNLEVQVVQNRIEAQNKQYLNDKNEIELQNKNQQMLLFAFLFIVITFSAIILIRKNKRIRKQHVTIQNQLSELKIMLKQKQVLLSELQHRVKNNLQHVINILDFQKESMDYNSIEEITRSTQNRIHSMALLHKKMHISEEVSDIDLKRYIQELSTLIKSSYDEITDHIELHFDCQEITITLEKAIPLGLIIVELISNSMKHAFKDKLNGHIYISCKKKNKAIHLRYADNGSGFEFNANQQKGLGQEIIKGLIDQLNGQTDTNSINGFELNLFFNNAQK